MKLFELTQLAEGKLTPAEVSKIVKAVQDAPDADMSSSHFDQRDGAEIYLPNVGFTKSAGPMKVFGFTKSEVKTQTACYIPINGNNLHYAQMSVQKNHLLRVTDKLKDVDPDEDLPLVVYEDGKFHVQNGHHRLTVLKLAGRDYVKVLLSISYRDPDTRKDMKKKPKVDSMGRFVEPTK